MKKILVLCKGWFEELPPVMTAAHILRELGMDVGVVCSQSADSTKADFASQGIAVLDVCPGFASDSLLHKAAHWARFRKEAWKAVDKEKNANLLWIGSVDGALALGKHLLHRRFVLQVHELYDAERLYRRLMKRYVKCATAVVMPESVRAPIFRLWYQLPKTPFVVPNKPWKHPRIKKLPMSGVPGDVAERIMSLNRRLVLYQGHIVRNRDIRTLAAVVHESDDMQFAVMGKDHGFLPAIREACPSVICVPHIKAPAHLEVTSHADVGVLCYNYTDMNHLFCAPNKIWEYSGFGIPMIRNHVPSLDLAMDKSGAGLCASFDDPDDIRGALRRIFERYDTFNDAALRFCESVNKVDEIEKVLIHCGHLPGRKVI